MSGLIGITLDDSSDSEYDADYVPSGAESDDVSDGDGTGDNEDVAQRQSGKVKKWSGTSRKRCGGIRLEDEQDAGSDGSEQDADLDEQPTADDKKERSDSLWMDFLKDVDPPAKSKLRLANTPTPSSPVTNAKQEEERQKSSSSTDKVTITKVYHFAGEEVTVKKDVTKDSPEAQQFLQQQGSENEKSGTGKTPTSSPSNKPPSTGAKRPAGLNSIIGKIIDKKSKLSVLEKSKLDWDQFKQEEDIAEELQTHNRGKGGFLEKQAFLQRTDLRQFEIEKEIRSKMRKQTT